MKTRISQCSALIGLVVFFHGTSDVQAQPCMTWVQRTDVGSPGQRAHHAMAYDSDRHVTVFFGGEIGTSGNETYFNDTWEYNGTNWTPITITGSKPSARSTHSMAYDPVHHQVVMYGGRDANGEMRDTWTYQGNGTNGVWTLANNVFDYAAEGAMVWDSVHSQVLLLEGAVAQRFLWNGSSYSYTGGNIAGGYLYYSAGMVFDPVLGMAIAAGGYKKSDGGADPHETADAYAFSASGPVTRLVSLPSARKFPMMAYDSRRKKTVIGGGDNGQSGTGESVYEYDSAQPTLGWQAGVALPSGLGRAGGAMVYDEARGVMVLMGGAGAGAPNGNDGGRYPDTWELTPTALNATLQSPGGAVCSGDPLTLTIIPGDARPLKYQWYVGTPPAMLPSYTNAVLNIPTNNAVGTRRYTVIMQDDCGNQFSRFVDITTHVEPVPYNYGINGVTNQCPGGEISFSVAYVSDPPATFQWYRDGAFLPGQTNADINLTNLKKEDSGHYHLVLSNSCGVVDTLGQFDFPLQVGPGITTQPVSVITNPCDGADFTVAAVGVGTIRYQWRSNGVPILEGGYFSGTTSSHLHVGPLIYSLEQAYDVVVTDDCGPENAVISTSAVLRLPTPPWVEVEMKPSPPEQENRRGNWVSAYDENRGVLVMYGGTDGRGYRANSLWEYDGLTWTPIQDAFLGPVTTNGQTLFYNNTIPPSSYAAIYNPDDHFTYIFGDYSGATPLTIWTWNGTNWHQPYSGPVTGGEQYYRAVYDRQNHKILLTRTHNGGYQSELLVYDPVSNIVSPPQVMQPPLEAGVFRAFWVYDEYRQLGFWYQNDGVGFGPSTMWALGPAMNWTKLTGTPPLPNYANLAVTYDPVRRHVVEFGSAAAYPYETSTRIFPGSSTSGMPAATDWLEALPDGPPWNSGGLGISPTNTFFPETIAFDRHRRALVASGYVGPISVNNAPPFPTWTTYESRYKDAVVFDHSPVFNRPSIGGTLTLKAYAAGYGSLDYKWRHNGTQITNGVAGAGGGFVSGATNSMLTITGVMPSDLGNYDVIVSNQCGAVASLPVTVTPGGVIYLSRPAITNGMLTIQVAADPGTTLTIERTASLPGTWSKVTNTVVSPAGLAAFIEPVPGEKTRFYRAVSPAY